MNKKNLLNISGIILSLLLSSAVWYAVTLFIQSSQNKILDNQNTTNIVTINVSEAASFTGAFIEKKFTSQAVADILTYWSKEAMSIHDVKAGQVPLEDAMKIATDCVDYLIASDIINDSTEEYSFNFALYGPSDSEALGNAEQYSYWNAVLINSFYTISFHINAVNGEIWYIKITKGKGSPNFNDISPVEALWIYEAYLNLSTLGPLYSTSQSAYKVYNSLYVSNAIVDENQIVLQLLPY